MKENVECENYSIVYREFGDVSILSMTTSSGTACHFMSTNFFISMVIRVVCLNACLALRALSWSSDNRDFSMPILWSSNLFILTLFESANYCSMRSKALLFKRVKEMGRQEQQLSNLLDTMPDKFLIATRALEAKAPMSVYSNR